MSGIRGGSCNSRELISGPPVALGGRTQEMSNAIRGLRLWKKARQRIFAKRISVCFHGDQLRLSSCRVEMKSRDVKLFACGRNTYPTRSFRLLVKFFYYIFSFFFFYFDRVHLCESNGINLKTINKLKKKKWVVKTRTMNFWKF